MLRNTLLVIAGCVSLQTNALSADRSIIIDDCISDVAPISKLHFNVGKHRLWYETFWNSHCTGLQPLGMPPWGDNCTTSEGGWNDAVVRLLKSVQPAEKPRLLEKICKLGELIGYEWAKDNDVRCIDTNNLKELRSQVVASSTDLAASLDKVEKRAKSICVSTGSVDSRRTKVLNAPGASTQSVLH